ncbi:uncharacterized protein [Miscanthus floridulus]|uniref:uncharacterized protein n=1 Tax=Miscanthus floridulus TaxID=154761 RepID=UPI0034596F93
MLHKVNYRGTTHETWESIKHTFGDSSKWDDGKFKKEDEPKEEVHEDVDHIHNSMIVEECSSSWSSDDDVDATTRSLDKGDVDATSDASDDSTSSTLDDGYESDASTSSPTSPHCFTSQGDAKVSIGNVVVDRDDPNFELENNKLKKEVKNLSNKLERCYNSKVTFEHMMKTQRSYGDKSGLGFNKSKKDMTKEERKRAKKMKKLLQKKISHSMCY